MPKHKYAERYANIEHQGIDYYRLHTVLIGIELLLTFQLLGIYILYQNLC